MKPRKPLTFLPEQPPEVSTEQPEVAPLIPPQARALGPIVEANVKAQENEVANLWRAISEADRNTTKTTH